MSGVIRKGIDLSSGVDLQTPSVPSEGSSDVFVNNTSVVRVGDLYEPHTSSESHEGRTASAGSPNVFVNNKAVHRANDGISCGDTANIVGSPNVFVNS
ncbi:MAG: hypothetical protein ACXW0J_07510 [Nitrososphaeraceae archaeon]